MNIFPLFSTFPNYDDDCWYPAFQQQNNAYRTVYLTRAIYKWFPCSTKVNKRCKRKTRKKPPEMALRWGK